MTSESGVPRAIAELKAERTRLEAERAHLDARLAKVDEAIATLRDLFHLPKGSAPAASVPSATVGAHQTPKSVRTQQGILAALERGPMTPGDLAVNLKMKVDSLRYHLAQMERDGQVVTSGNAHSRRVALAGAPAKEVP